MEREWLEERLASGASIEAIAREVGRDPSTVSYWVRKHGLTSSHAQRHAPRGPIARELLAEMIDYGVPIRGMAELLNCSPTTIRHWLGKHGLATEGGARRADGRQAAGAAVERPTLHCPRHGLTAHVPRADGSFRCSKCRSEQVAERRRRVKRQLIEEAGGRCALCGYHAFAGALQFHHVDRQAKEFSISGTGVTRAIATARAEAAKCVLLCANCHAEVEGGFAQVPLRSGDPPAYPA